MTDRRTSRVIVVGSVNRDVVVTAPRRPEMGETLIGWDVGEYPGGKGANQAIAAAGAKAHTLFVGCIGDDPAGVELRDHLDAAGVDVRHLRIGSAPTGQAFITLVDGDNAVIVISGANSEVARADVESVDITAADVLLTQFEIPTDSVLAVVETGRRTGARTLINPSPARETPDEVWALSDVIVTNEIELEWLRATYDIEGAPSAPVATARALLRRPDQAIVVTLGERGCVVVDSAGALEISGHDVAVIDTTGAGDCFLGYLASELAGGRTLRAAAVIANAAASVCVQRMGASSSMPDAAEMDAALRPQDRALLRG